MLGSASTPSTRTSGRQTRVSSAANTLLRPDGHVEDENGTDPNSELDNVVEETEKPKEDGAGGEEEAVTTRRGGRRKVPTPKALAAKDQVTPTRQLRRRTKQAPQAAHNDSDDEKDENDNDDSSGHQHNSNSPEPDGSASQPTKADKKRFHSSTVTAGQSPKSKRGRKPGAGLKTASPLPKGILTPSKKRRHGPAKSVAFSSSRTSDKETEDQLGFRDIDPSITHKDKEEPLTELVTAIRRHILQRLTSSSRPASSPSLIPPHLSSAYSTLSALLSSTITTSESNSLLLLGARGSGKSLLVNTALSSLSHQYGNDFHVVHLNGFLQTDDRLALREIWRQLGRERAVDEEETGQVMSSYADTMAGLLGLLSHPEEIGPDAEAEGMDTANTAAPPTLSKSVIIVIDEFDLLTTHPRQTLLYNLFDIAQSRKAPIAVIGCSTRMDVVDCLEKRVKSRFSHRWIHVPTAKTLAAFTECVQTVLCISDDEVVADVDEADRQQWNQAIANDLLSRPPVCALITRSFYSTSVYLAPAVNFNAVFAHYSLLHRHTRSKLATASSSFRLWSKPACKHQG
ncbi:hypothetical protein DV735_g3719, partial [Chaetothyriales sp. CBS 134920]